MIRFEGVSKRYKQQTVLNNISMEINQGELVVLVGSSGCGKTTTLKMINALITPTSGSIFIGDEDITKKNPIDLRRGIGYVIQQTGLFPHLTVRENIEIIPRIEKKPEKEVENRTIELMDMVGLSADQYLDRYPIQLSGGQQQRIGVARAFSCDPEIILMDEPFSALDPITRSQLQDELVDLQAKLKKTIVFVTHDMDEAIKIADRICIMYQGEIAQYDIPEEILKNPASDFVADFVGKGRIWSAPELIRARDIMILGAVRGTPEMTIERAIQRMRMRKVDSLIITDPAKHVLGVLSATAAQSTPQKEVLVTQVMNQNFLAVDPSDSILDILKKVNQFDLSNVPVVNEEGVLQGLITRSSLVTTLSQQYMDDGANQEDVRKEEQ